MRGDGSIYARGESGILWLRYSWHGKEFRESTGTTDMKEARKMLRQRQHDRVKKPQFVGPKENRWTLDDMLERIRAHYVKKQNRSFETVEGCFKHLKDGFPFHRVVDITAGKIEEYQLKRLKDGAARASVNREMAYLRLGFRLMIKAGELSTMPVITLMQEDNTRQGFIRVADFLGLLGNIPDPDVRDMVEFLYNSGWRSGEPKAMQWSWLDLDTWTVRLPAEYSKNKKPRILPLEDTLREVIERRIERRDLTCPYVFHRKGRPIKSFRKAFRAAAKAIGQPGLIPHDMRRSAVRNFRKAGLSESDGMALSGHRTRAVYDRYDIRDEEDSRQALKQAQAYAKQEAENRKVIPIRKQA